MTDPKNMTDEQWRGYVTAKLEDLLECSKELKSIVSGQRWKIGIMSGGLSLAITVLVLLLTKHI